MAEVVEHFYPKLVELHNYSSASAMTQKMYNWNTLNAKVFRKLDFTLDPTHLKDLCTHKTGAVEYALKLIKHYLGEFQKNNGVVKKQNMKGGVAPPPVDFHKAGEEVKEAFGFVVTDHKIKPGMLEQNIMLPTVGDGAVNPETGEEMAQQPQGELLRYEDPTGEMIKKDLLIAELRETNAILDTKARKLEQLVRLKEAKVQTLLNKLQALSAQ